MAFAVASLLVVVASHVVVVQPTLAFPEAAWAKALVMAFAVAALLVVVAPHVVSQPTVIFPANASAVAVVLAAFAVAALLDVVAPHVNVQKTVPFPAVAVATELPSEDAAWAAFVECSPSPTPAKANASPEDVVSVALAALDVPCVDGIPAMHSATVVPLDVRLVVSPLTHCRLFEIAGREAPETLGAATMPMKPPAVSARPPASMAKRRPIRDLPCAGRSLFGGVVRPEGVRPPAP
jgi:hypothetical protein